MKLKNFDAKQFLLEKGERAGLGVALGLLVLLILASLFLPGKGFFSGSPAVKESALKQLTTQVQTALANNSPTDADLPPKKAEGKDKEKAADKFTFNTLAPDEYAIASLFAPGGE